MECTRSFRRRVGLPAVLALVAGAALLAPTPSFAEVETYNIDPDHTAVTFSIRHFFSRVPGRFTKFEGTILLDEKDFTLGSVNFTIDTASIDTNEPARDKHLRSDAFFDAENHPKITFSSMGVKVAGDNKLKVTGDLTIRGITKRVVLDVEALGFGELYSVRRAAFEIRLKIDRTDFNVSWNDIVEGGGAILGTEVTILINLEAKLQKKKA